MAQKEQVTKDQSTKKADNLMSFPFPLYLNQDVFESEDGKKIPYFNFKVDINGEFFTLSLKSDDKKLFKYVLKNELGIEL